MVLEARERVGGRIHTVEMQHGAPVDLGAAYIHGCDAYYNPVRVRVRVGVGLGLGLRRLLQPG